MDNELTWQDIEERFDIKFTLENGEFRRVNEWLDDIFLTFTPEDLTVMMSVIMNHPELFKDITTHEK